MEILIVQGYCYLSELSVSASLIFRTIASFIKISSGHSLKIKVIFIKFFRKQVGKCPQTDAQLNHWNCKENNFISAFSSSFGQAGLSFVFTHPQQTQAGGDVDKPECYKPVGDYILCIVLLIQTFRILLCRIIKIMTNSESPIRYQLIRN